MSELRQAKLRLKAALIKRLAEVESDLNVLPQGEGLSSDEVLIAASEHQMIVDSVRATSDACRPLESPQDDLLSISSRLSERPKVSGGAQASCKVSPDPDGCESAHKAPSDLLARTRQTIGSTFDPSRSKLEAAQSLSQVLLYVLNRP